MADSSGRIFYGGNLIHSIDCGCSSLGALVSKRLLENGDSVAFIDAITGATVTFLQLLEHAKRVCGRLEALGIKKGSIVAIVSENRLDFSIAAFASFFRNATVVPLNPNYTETEFNHVLNIIRPSLIFASNKPLSTLGKVNSQHPYIKWFVSLDDQTLSGKDFKLSDWIQESRQVTLKLDPVILKNDVAVMVLSSGTTGHPKAVQLTHHNVMTVLAYMREDPRYTDLPEPVRVLGLLPFFHVYGFMLMMNASCNRYPMVVLPRFEATLFLQSIQEHKVSMANLVPPLLVFLAKNPAVERYDLSSLKTILSGAAPISVDIENQVLKRLPHVESIRAGYGLSEASLGVISKSNFKPGSVGRVHKTCWVKVVDVESGSTLGAHQTGEICIKGPLVMKGYYRNPEATRQTIDSEGWLHTGDTGYFDQDGDFFIVDRIKDLIKYKGFQVAPAELEDILLSHPGIKDAAVIGLPDEACGELPAAFVVLQPDHSSSLSEQEIRVYVAEKLSPQKQLRGGVYFTAEIPKTASGKILRRQLRDQLTRERRQKAKL
ncbi:uncharacterized protein LOC129739547 [Uranotaenia lowii]|uniref:uncharacterized protein LOC129739547 n=1 Tax=Uranotaenia lowii TaxID=190385 RepID=UPI00247A077D|nr:uncharacterized protein LOC129739547 [Uranotaenia lowii]